MSASGLWRMGPRRRDRRKPLATLSDLTAEYLERLRARMDAQVERLESGCWVWRGRMSGRYGAVWLSGDRRTTSHRVMWMLERGDIGEGLELDHLCRNKRCCNPAHLEPVTHAENMRRHAAAAPPPERDTCINGHSKAEHQSASGQCRECHRASERRRYWRLKANAQSASGGAPDIRGGTGPVLCAICGVFVPKGEGRQALTCGPECRRELRNRRRRLETVQRYEQVMRSARAAGSTEGE